MSANPTQEDLSSASTEHIRAARAALAVGIKRSGASGAAPRSAAYLAHIAMECALKLRMLMQHHRARTEEMRKVMKEQDFDLLFRSNMVTSSIACPSRLR